MNQPNLIIKKLTNKIITDCNKLEQIVKALRLMNNKIVTTIGSWDLLHIGHVRYLMQAKSYGDILVVGVDSDSAIKLYKGPLRPVVPESERSEMLSYQFCVDLIVSINDVNQKGDWQYGMIKKIKPDTFIAVEDSYSTEQKKMIKKYCKKLIILPRQAEETSTSSMIQKAVKGHLTEMMTLIEKR